MQIDLPQGENLSLAEQLIRTLKRAGYQLLARKVETPSQYKLARELGFDLLQGFAIAEPAVHIK